MSMKKRELLNLDITDYWKKFRKKVTMSKLWNERNLEHGEVTARTLEVEFVPFNQSIFVEDSAALDEKLRRIGFEPLVGFPDENLYSVFSRIMYHKQFNVALSLYKPEHSYAILTAIDIVNDSINSNYDRSIALTVFLSAVRRLMPTPATNKKQTLLG